MRPQNSRESPSGLIQRLAGSIGVKKTRMEVGSEVAAKGHFGYELCHVCDLCRSER